MDTADALATLPGGLRKELLDTFSEIVNHFRAGRWEPSELNGGKFCEVVYTIVKGHCDSKYPLRASKPKNMPAACLALEAYTGATRGLRIQIPRMLVALYEIRNNRNVGHVGGDVDPNHMDAVCVLQMSKWILAELVRNFHGVALDEASALVDVIVEREVPAIWSVNEVRRVLPSHLSTTNQALLLLYTASGPLAANDLIAWLEYSNPSRFKAKILGSLHKGRYVEYDQSTGTVTLSPTGADFTEGMARHYDLL